MRNLKKFLALVLAMLMVVSASATVSAFADVDEDNQYAGAIADLVEKGITNGIDEDNFGPDDAVERYQMALFMARALDPSVTDWSTGMSVFTDVTEWSGAIAYAYMNNIVTGIGGGLFAPNDGIKYQDALIMAVRALGYTVDVSGDPYWLAAYKQATTLGLTNNVAVTNGEKTLTRAETAQIIYNMLYATPADGGATIAATNFGEATAENTTTFVITATANQAYAEVAVSADEDYVGLQPLANGVPSGDVIYLPVELFGFDADEADDYFGYAFDFVNYNTKTGAFDKIIPGLDPVIIYNTDVAYNSATSATKFTYDSVAYYPVEQITGAALKNEIVVFNGGELAYASKMLLLNSDGDIVDSNGNIVAKFAYSTSTGVNYYASGSSVITESEALSKYGVEIDDGTYATYNTLTAADLSATVGNYQLTMFDDDRDGKYERAIATPVYVSVYYYNSSSYEYTDGPWYDDGNSNYGVTFTESLSKGDVFVYTYNRQTLVANVIEILDVQSGTLDKVNTTNVAGTTVGSSYYAVKVTIDGTVYTLGNEKREKYGLTGATIYQNKTDGVTMSNINNLVGKDADGNSWNGGRPAISYIFDSTSSVSYASQVASKLVSGSAIRYIAYGDQIIYAETYDVDDDFDYVVLDDIVSYDDEAVYLDLYIDGKLTEDVTVTKINGKTIADLSVFQLSKLLGDDDLFEDGNVFRAVKLSDGSYQLSEYLDLSVSGKVDSLDDFALTQLNDTGIVEFDDGIADEYTNGNAVPTQNTIRTDSSTIFYFINTSTGVISTYVGIPDDGAYLDLSGVEVYLDKLGYGSTNDFKGVADVAFVYYTNSNYISGFGVSNLDVSYIFVSSYSNYADKYDIATAESLGLDTDNYTGAYYYYNVDNLAVDLDTGSEVQVVYSKSKLLAGYIYKIDSNKVVTETVGNIDNVTGELSAAYLRSTDFNQSRYYEIGSNGSIVATSDAVTSVKLFSYSYSGTVYTDSITSLLNSKTTDVAKQVVYINNAKLLEDGIFVGIVTSKTQSATPTTITSNATYTYNSTPLTATITAPSTAELKNFKLTVYVGSTTTIDTTLADNVAAGEATSVTLAKGGDSSFALAAGEKAYITKNSDGTINITVGTSDFSGVYAKTLTAGTYQLTIVFANENAPTDTAVRTLVYTFTVS